MSKFNCIIMGAAGRDFHDFLTFFKSHPEFRVRAFTATQIPFIETRTFPASLAGPDYAEDIPIFNESRLPELIKEFDVDWVFFAYSDMPHEEVMHRASIAQAHGATFAVLGPKHTALKPDKPVFSVCAVRTGAGKSPLSQALTAHVTARGKSVGVIRHPMPYGDLAKQAVQRFATPADLDEHKCTIEEREEYAPYVARGLVIYAGVDYEAILRLAEKENDVILWDGGNNDTSFVQSGLRIVVVDPLRPGHEMGFYPGETNLRNADVLVISKVGQAKPEDVEAVKKNIAEANPKAEVIEANLELTIPDEKALEGKRVLVVEDGPTLTHGGMAYGAGMVAAKRFGAKEVVDPKAAAVGTIAEAYVKYPHLKEILPALGYSDEQLAELRESIANSGADIVVDASPAGLADVMDPPLPMVRVGYKFSQVSGPDLFEKVDEFLGV